MRESLWKPRWNILSWVLQRPGYVQVGFPVTWSTGCNMPYHVATNDLQDVTCHCMWLQMIYRMLHAISCSYNWSTWYHMSFHVVTNDLQEVTGHFMWLQMIYRMSQAISCGYKWDILATFIWIVTYFLHALTYYTLPLLSPEGHLKQISHKSLTGYIHLTRTRNRQASTAHDLHLSGPVESTFVRSWFIVLFQVKHVHTTYTPWPCWPDFTMLTGLYNPALSPLPGEHYTAAIISAG